MIILRQKEFGIKEWLKGQTEGDKRRKEKTVEKLSKHKLTDEELEKTGLKFVDVKRVDVDRSDVNRADVKRTDVKRNSTGYKSSRLNTLDKEGKLYEEARKAARKNQIGKAAMIALPTAAAIGTGVAIKKHHDKKKKEEKE